MKTLTRRSFLARCAALAAASTLPSFNIRASDKSGSGSLVVGSGEHTYECVHDWLVPPEGLVWGDTHGLCQDAAGNIYVAHTVNKASMRGEAIVVYDAVREVRPRLRRGVPRRRARAQPAARGERREPLPLRHQPLQGREDDPRPARSSGSTATRGRIPPTAPPRSTSCPRTSPSRPNGDFYVGDGYGSSHVLRFSASGTFLGEVGRPGHG
jgi:hypothetical protein